jgi:hypothetical protein
MGIDLVGKHGGESFNNHGWRVCAWSAQSRTFGTSKRTIAFEFFESSGERQPSFVTFPKSVAGRVRQILKQDPYVASGRACKIFPPDLLTVLWQVSVDTVRIKRLRVFPVNLGSLRIDFKPGFLSDCQPSRRGFSTLV